MENKLVFISSEVQEIHETKKFKGSAINIEILGGQTNASVLSEVIKNYFCMELHKNVKP